MTDERIYNKINKLLGAQDERITALEGVPLPVAKDGARGERGETGETGARGERGETGARGERGETGAPGADGRDGRDGTSVNAEDVATLVQSRIRVPEDGAQGDRGETGAQGDRGQRGPRGERGAKGDRGEPGTGITKVELKQNKLFVALGDTKAQQVGELQFEGPDMFVGPEPQAGGGAGRAATNAAKGALKWLGTYQPGQNVRKDTIVEDAGWLMVTNKDTTDRAAPQPTGPARNIFDGALVPEQETAKQVIFGTRYTAQRTFSLSGYRVDVVAGNFYQVVAVTDPNGPNPIFTEVSSFLADVTGWREVATQPTIVLEGQEFDVVAVANEPDPTPTTFDGTWSYSKPGGAGGPDVDPLAGQIVQANNSPAVLKIHKTDLDAVDRSADLSGLSVGDIINSQGLRWSIQTITDEGDFYRYLVAPAAQAPGTGPALFTFETVTATPITYGRDAGYWDTVGAVNIRGLFGADTDYNNLAVLPDAFGVDLFVQDLDASDDWDYMSSAADVSASGGGGRSVEIQELGSFETTATQSPSGPGDAGKITITFGPGGSTQGNEFTLDANGILTTNPEAGDVQYRLEGDFRISRSGGGGSSIPLIRFMYAPDGVPANGVQVGGTFSARIDDASTTWRESFNLSFAPVPGSIVWLEFARDAAGNNSGDLSAPQPSGDLSGWNPVATARLTLSKRVTI